MNTQHEDDNPAVRIAAQRVAPRYYVPRGDEKRPTPGGPASGAQFPEGDTSASGASTRQAGRACEMLTDPSSATLAGESETVTDADGACQPDTNRTRIGDIQTFHEVNIPGLLITWLEENSEYDEQRRAICYVPDECVVECWGFVPSDFRETLEIEVEGLMRSVRVRSTKVLPGRGNGRDVSVLLYLEVRR